MTYGPSRNYSDYFLVAAAGIEPGGANSSKNADSQQNLAKSRQINALANTSDPGETPSDCTSEQYPRTSATHPDTDRLYGTTKIPADLAELIDAWPNLNNHAKREITTTLRKALQR